MKKLKLVLIVGLFSVSISGISQNYESEIKAMFASKDNVDYNFAHAPVLGQNYISNEILYVEPAHHIALKDIDFIATYSYKPSYDFCVLVIKPKQNCVSYYDNKPGKEWINIYLPNQAFTDQTIAYLQKLAGYNPGIVSDPVLIKPSANQEPCNSTISFLNELKNSNFKNYSGEMISSDKGFRKFASKVSFPAAIQTSISDTNVFFPLYRSAEVLLMKETLNNNTVSAEMNEKYSQLTGELKNCLEPNGFSYVNKDNNQMKLYKLQTDFTLFPAPDPEDLLSNLQAESGMVVHIRVSQRETEEGKFSNELVLEFMIQ